MNDINRDITIHLNVPLSYVIGADMATNFLNFGPTLDQILALVQGINQKVTAQGDAISQLVQQGASIMAAIDNLEAEVGQVSTVVGSVETLLDMLHQELQDAIASGDPARVQAAADMLAQERQRLVDAVMRNTDVMPGP